MKSYFFNVILGILAFIVVLVPFTGKVHYGRLSRGSWIKGFTNRGWIVCFAFILSIGINYLKDLQTENDDIKKTKAVNVEKRQSDSIDRKRNDESNQRIVTAFTSALAKYNLKYDSTQKAVLRVVRDSSKKAITIIKDDEPDLLLSSIKLKSTENNLYHFNITVLSQNAASQHIYVKMYVMDEEDHQYFLMSGKRSGDFFAKDGSLGKNESFSFNIDFTAIMPPSNFYLLLMGTYKDVGGKKLRVYRIYSYNLRQGVEGVPLEPYYTKINAFFHDNVPF